MTLFSIVQSTLSRASRFAGKWLYDGCTSIPQIERLQRQAARLRELEIRGWRVEGSVCDDYAFLTPAD